jgi:hypothetical protein
MQIYVEKVDTMELQPLVLYGEFAKMNVSTHNPLLHDVVVGGVFDIVTK